MARYQPRCPKQNNTPLEEFVTKALRTLVDEAGYSPSVKEKMLRDTLVLVIDPDKVRKDEISKDNSHSFKNVYDLAKTEEGTESQMEGWKYTA